MQHSQLYQKLATLLQNSQQAIYILYQLHSIPIKICMLFIIAYSTFRIGRSSLSDPLQNQINSMQNVIKNREKYTKIIPRQISRLQILIVILFSMLILTVGAYMALDFINHPIIFSIQPTITVMILGSWMAVVIILWIYKKVLEYRLGKGGFNDHQIHDKLNKIEQLLGSKVLSILRYTLCRDLIKSQPVNRIQMCSKDRCKKYRGLLKAKTDCISKLVENVLNFDWCSICKKVMPFDQFLSFQANFYSASNKDEQGEVNERNNYLIGQLQRMGGWCKNLNACNCSMRYWSISRKEISQFKKKQKQIDQDLSIFQSFKSPSK